MPEASPATPGGPPPSLMRAIRRVLGPLVRLLLQHQIDHSPLSITAVYDDLEGVAGA